MAKKVLIICYYWPPAGGSGVQRHLKFAKYLRDFGWEPIIYTPQNGEYPEIDSSLLAEVPQNIKVIKRPILEPYSFYKLFTGKKKKEKITPNFFSQKNESFLSKTAIFLRSNFFIPDARMWWIKPSVKYLTNYLEKNPVDAIVSTGPPHSLHIIGKEVSIALNLPWLADFRDPWTNIDYFKELSLLPFAKEKHERLEKEVLQTATRVVTVSPTWAMELAEIGNRAVDVITNGFDEQDFAHTQTRLDEKFSIVHPGMFSRARNHESFWQAISEMCQENSYFAKDVKVIFYGITDPSVMQMAEKYKLTESVEIRDYLPHDKIIEKMASAWVLLLSVHDSPNLKGFVPGKLFEYLASKRPILCLGPENGDSAGIILDSKAGLVSGFKDKNKLKINLSVFYSDFINGRAKMENANIEKFSRRNLTGKLAGILDEMLSDKV
ncbi:MAG: glycosyltransferase family 4 protein [Opitutaceae bacterium]|nr:glycosyltransferase family 4 protein [Cytophagales bacterium]